MGAKAHIVALDIFTGKKYEDLCPTSHNVEGPFVKLTEFQLLSINEHDGSVSLLDDTGNTKDDLNLPTQVSIGEPTEDDKKVAKEMQEQLDNCPQVIVLAACGMEKIVAV